MTEDEGRGPPAYEPSPAQTRTRDTATRAGSPGRSYGRGVRVLSVGIASTGLLTLAYFSIASHVLGAHAASRLNLLWSVMFVVISVIYRPIEQLLSRTLAERRAHGHGSHPLRVPIALQLAAALAFLLVALALRGPLVNRVFDRYAALYWVLVVGTLAYAASYFARGWLAGHEYFPLFGALVFMEAASRLCFALAVAVGFASGQTAVALGIAAAPLVSLVVVPAAFARNRRGRGGEPEPAVREEISLARGGRFALWVSAAMLSEQAILNAAVLTVAALQGSRAVLVGIVFNVLLIARAPLQLFQAIQTSLLPHLTGLEATAGHDAFTRAIRVTLLAVAAFAAAVALGLLTAGPFVMSRLFGQHFVYNRFGLALVGLGMGLHLASGTLNQAALARDCARAAALCWLAAAVAFVAWMLTPAVGEQLLRAEIGYFGATALLAALLAVLYRRGTADRPA
jgi:O-antigen/teichoic acid export membrane protein